MAPAASISEIFRQGPGTPILLIPGVVSTDVTRRARHDVNLSVRFKQLAYRRNHKQRVVPTRVCPASTASIRQT